MRNHTRDVSHAERLRLVAPQTQCPFCQSPLWILETRIRHVQTLQKLLRLELKGKKCSAESCEHQNLRYRPPEEGRLVLKAHEFGLDVVVFAGEQYHREHRSIPMIHKELHQRRHLPICERSVGNLIEDYEALCECVAADTDRLRARLKQQGAVILSVDGVQYDDRSPVLYVQRDALSREVLYSERRLARSKDDLVPMLQRTHDLARQLGIPILGVVSDKERSLVPAIAEVFVGIPHQFCHTHYLGNVAKPLDEEDRQLGEAAREVVQTLREVQREVERKFPHAGAKGQRTPRDGEPAAADGAGERSAPEAPTSGPPPVPPVPVEATEAAREAEVAAALARAGATVGKVSGRPIVDPGGLKRYERLQEVRQAAQKAAKKGGPRRAAGL